MSFSDEVKQDESVKYWQQLRAAWPDLKEESDVDLLLREIARIEAAFSDAADDSEAFLLLDKLNSLELELLTQKHRTIGVARWSCLSISSLAIAAIVLVSPTLTGWLGNLLAGATGMYAGHSLWKLWDV